MTATKPPSKAPGPRQSVVAPVPAPTAKSTKKSAFSCEPCRRRKVKCGGEQPVCKRCASREDACVYKLNPTLSYTQRLEERIQQLEGQLNAVLSSQSSTSPSSSSSPSTAASLDSSSQRRHFVAVPEHGVTRGLGGLQRDDSGAVTYHGATSFFHVPSERSSLAAAMRVDQTDGLDGQRRERLVSNAWEQRALENLSEIPEPYQYLLNIHWYWAQPLFQFIYRPAFTRDMNSSGPYYSCTLLNTVLSHSTRFGQNDPAMRRVLDQHYEGGRVFARMARESIFDEIDRGVPSIPTIQSLLLLSAQECGLGHSTQAWSYSGLALRLMDHVGILVDGYQYPGSVRLSDEDVEIRHRLYWGCFIWDKMISLYLGRAPSMVHTAAAPPPVVFDNSTDDELWTPFGATKTDWKYPPTTSSSASCFTSMCQLALIFNEILVHMYDPLLHNTQAEMQECLDVQETALQRWWDGLDASLRVETTALPPLAPPAHVVTANCLFHTFKILLFRPMLTMSEGGRSGEPLRSRHACLVECVTSATSILALFDLFCRTFGSEHCDLAIVYSVYIAASVFLLQAQAAPADHSALRRLEVCVQALTQLEPSAPIISSGLSLLRTEFEILRHADQASGGAAVMELSDRAFTFDGKPFSAATEHPTNTYTPGPLFETPWGDSFASDPNAMDPIFFENLSNLSPITARVGAVASSQTSFSPHQPDG